MRVLLVSVLSLVLSSLLWTPTASAVAVPGGESTASCFHRWTDSISPGLTTTPGRVTFTSHGETGTIDCTGQVRGQHVTGPGTFGEEGVVNGTCVSGSGSAVFSFSIPTTGGVEKFSIPVTFTYGALSGLTSSAAFPGAFVIVPTGGDCVTSAITEITVSRLGSLTS